MNIAEQMELIILETKVEIFRHELNWTNETIKTAIV